MREMYELWGKWETTMGAPDDDDGDLEDLLFLESFEEAAFAMLAFAASSETCEDAEGMKQLRRDEEMAM